MIKTVAIVSLSAGTIGEDFVKHEVNIGLKRLEQFGLNVKIMPHAMKGIEYVKNHPKERANDLLAAICDEEVDMILCAIGGDDTLGGIASHSQEQLKKIPVPFVLSTVSLLGKEYKNDYSFVSVDDVKESCRMTEHLISQGHEKIALLCSYKEDVSIGALRLTGYKKALEAHNIPVDERRIRHMDPELDSYSMESGYRMTKALLKEGVDCTAIFAISDSLAIGAVRALIDAGKRVPMDISVAGFDGTEMAAYYNPSITTIRQPAETMARETIKLLFDSIKKKTNVQQLIFEGELVPGESVKKLN